MASTSSLSKQGPVSMLDEPYKWAVAILCNVDNGQVLSWEQIFSLLSSQVTPEEWKRARPLIHLPLHQPAELAECTQERRSLRAQTRVLEICMQDLPQGSQSLLSSSRARLAPHHSSKALGSSAHNSHMSPHQNF